MAKQNSGADNLDVGKKSNFFDVFSAKVTKAVGSTPAFTTALLIVIAWAVTGPIFNYSETWQLIINTGTTIVTFLMVFLIQKSQNKDSMAIQLKLNELIASHEYASNRLINIEDITEDELQTIRKFYVKLSQYAQKENSLHETHSLDEAKDAHAYKTHKFKNRKSSGSR